MWRLYLIYVVNTLKVLVLGAVAVGAWFLAVWVRGGDFGSQLFEAQHGLSTGFIALFLVFLMIGIGIVTPLLWGGRKKGDAPSGFPDNPGYD